MSTITDKKITDGQRNAVWVQHQQDRLTGTPQQNKAVFDEYSELIREHFNEAMDVLDERISTNDSDIEQLKETDAGVAATSARESAESASESAQATQDMLGRVISISNKIYTKSWDVEQEQDEFVFSAEGYTYNESDTYEVFVNGLKLSESEYTRNEDSVVLGSSISAGNTVEIIVTTNLKGKGIVDTELNDDYTLTINYDDGTSTITESIRGEKGEKGDKGDKGEEYDDTQVKSDISTLNARVDTFTHLSDGSTTGDAELTDIRVGADSNTYTSAGSAVRGQVSGLKSDLDGNRIVSVKTLTPKTLITTSVGVGNVVNLTQRTNGSTDSVIVPCQAGNMFLITGSGWNTERLWAFVDSSDKLLSISAGNATASNVLITAPMNASKLVCNFRRDTGNPYRLVAFDTAGLAVKAGGQNITDSTGALICGNDLNNLPVNSVFGVVPYSGLANMPYTETGSAYGGLIFTLSKESAANATMTQVIFRRDGHIFVRQRWTNYENWFEYYFDPSRTFIGSNQNITASTVNSICSGNADNLPNNRIYGINVQYDEISNLPPYTYGVNGGLNGDFGRYSGSVFTFGKEKARGYGDTQFFIGYGSYTYVRIYTNRWEEWRCLNEQKYQNAIGIGDSICEGWRNNNMGFVGMLGVPYENLGITGATLGTASGHTQIYTELSNIDYTRDIIIADGGINDYYFNVPLGQLPTRPSKNDSEASAIDKTTVSGGLSYLLYLMIKKMPNAQRFFLITHKTRNYPYTANSAGYTQQELHDRIVAICKLYNTKAIDVYEESIINSEFDAYVSPTSFSDDHSVTTHYYVDNDRIHPLWLGYQEGYMPIIKKELMIATTKVNR